MEGLHAADPITLECVQHLAASATLLPALTVLSGEPGEWLEDVDEERRLALEELTREQVEKVLRQSFTELEDSAALAAAVHERVHGNLLLLELLVAELVSSGGLKPESRGWVADLTAVRSCQRRRAKGDARAYAIKLTAQGAKALRDAEPGASATDSRLLAKLPPAKRQEFLESLQTIVTGKRK